MNLQFSPAQLLILGFSGVRPEKEFLSLISRFPPAGFLFLAENYENYRQFKSLIVQLRDIVGGDTLFMVDQEPGRVQRFKNGFPLSLTPQEYVQGNLTRDFANWCRQTAELMAELGLNMNLAPVLDLWAFGGKFPVLENRSFGDDPGRISDFAEILIGEFKKMGVMTCGKHFPGLGAARGDPHETTSYSHETPERFLNFHWLPFKAAIAAGVEALMTTHLLATSLDKRNITTCSEKIIDALRMQLNFDGLVIADDLYMAGAGRKNRMAGIARNAIAAGHNLLIISRDSAAQLNVIRELKKSYARDEKFGKIAARSSGHLQKLILKSGGSHA